MHACPSNVGKAVWRSVMPLLPGWIDAQRNDHQAPARPDQVQAVCTQLSQALDSALQAQLAKTLASWQPMLILQAQGLENRMSRACLSAKSLEQAAWGEKLMFRIIKIGQQNGRATC